MDEKEFNIVEREDLVPLCPHCIKELNEIYARARGLGFIEGRNTVYFCPHCMKVIGIGQSRMM